MLEAIFPLNNDALIVILRAVITFIIPVNLARRKFLNDWETAIKVPWGILILFGGGLAIAGIETASLGPNHQ